MKITENVIIDLYPLYLAGEASKDTIKLVEAYFAEHPEFEALLGDQDDPFNALSKLEPKKSVEKSTFLRIKSILRLRSVVFGLALFCTSFLFSVSGNSTDGVTYLLVRDSPGWAIFILVSAVALWIVFAWTYRVLREG